MSNEISSEQRTEAPRSEYVTRDALLKLLSDEEIGRISNRAGGPPLTIGDQYVDLEHPALGVLSMEAATKFKEGDILPRSGVKSETWSKIRARVSPTSSGSSTAQVIPRHRR